MKKPSLLRMLFLINILNNATNSFIVFGAIELFRNSFEKIFVYARGRCKSNFSWHFICYFRNLTHFLFFAVIMTLKKNEVMHFF
jgi:hypothetical protein